MLRTFSALVLAAALMTPAFAREKLPKEFQNLKDGIAAYEAKDYPTAVEKLTVAIETNKLKDDNLRTAYLVRGVSYSALNQCQNAVPDFDKVLELKDGEAQVYAQRGDCKVKLQQIQPGLADLKKSTELAPTDKTYAEFYCAAANNSKVYAEAGPACEAAVKNFPPADPQLIKASAQAYELSGNKAKAHEMWKMLAAADPADKDAKDGIARTK